MEKPALQGASNLEQQPACCHLQPSSQPHIDCPYSSSKLEIQQKTYQTTDLRHLAMLPRGSWGRRWRCQARISDVQFKLSISTPQSDWQIPIPRSPFIVGLLHEAIPKVQRCISIPGAPTDLVTTTAIHATTMVTTITRPTCCAHEKWGKRASSGSDQCPSRPSDRDTGQS